jgi:soluble lytic murein transglycosylase-like protein
MKDQVRGVSPIAARENLTIIDENKYMFICFIAALALAAPLSLGAATAEVLEHVSTVVRADRRTGRLVRRVVIPERVIQARIVKAGSWKPAATGSRVDEIVNEVSREQGVDPLIVHAVIQVESSYDRFALSPKGAQGLMQLIPGTARRFGVKNSWDSRQNIEGGVKYLRFLMDRYPNDLRLVFAGYNAGEEAVARYGGIPPYAETRAYVYKVGKRLGELRRRHAQAAPARTPQLVASRQGEPEYRPVESFVDAEGRLHLRTR